jgi:hypothetical protein
MHREIIAIKASRISIRVYSLFKSKRLSADIKLTLYKALIRSIMTYSWHAYPCAEAYPSKLQRLQNKVLLTTGNFPRSTPNREMQVV